MKAMIYTEYGSPDVLRLQEIEKPVPGDDEVLVKVSASSVNDWDWGLLRGTPFVVRLSGLRKPGVTILGTDVAGRVEAVGRAVTQFQPGDAVMGDLSGSGFGAYAEYVCVCADALILKPASMAFEQAAALPHVAGLAIQGLCHQGQLQPGQRLLLNGAGGGMGTLAIQIAKSIGAEVTGVDHTAKLDMMRRLGADHVIDYTQEDFTRNGQRYDLILDVKGLRSFFDYRRALSPAGRCVLIGGSMPRILEVLLLGALFSTTSSQRIGILPHHANEGLDLMNELFEAGKAAPIIARRYPLSETAEAMRYFGSGQAIGKVVITVVE